MIIEKGDIGTLDAILGYKSMNRAAVVIMQNFMSKYIEKNIHICSHCSAQLRHAHKRVTNWANSHAAAIEAVRNEGICIVCKTELTDKRRKYCSDACKNIHQNEHK